MNSLKRYIQRNILVKGTSLSSTSLIIGVVAAAVSNAVAVEMIYFIYNLNLVLLHCLLINLLQSFVSGSKKVSILNGKVTPAEYTTYKAWLLNFESNKIQWPAEDVVTYFDNVRKYVTKYYRVTSQKTKKADTITAFITSLSWREQIADKHNLKTL